MSSKADDARPGTSAPTLGRPPAGPPAGHRAGGQPEEPSSNPSDCTPKEQDGGFDSLGEVLAPSTQGRRGPPTLTLEIVWVNGPAAEALRRSQARVLRDLLAALNASPSRAPSEDEQEASP